MPEPEMSSYALSNRVEETYMLTTLTPILNIEPEDNGPSFQTRIREYLASLPLGQASPFIPVPALHFCRFVVVYDLPNEGYPAVTDHLNSPYLMMSASMAGDWKTCVESMLQIVPDVIHGVYSNCVAYPGTGVATDFLKYLEDCQVDAAFAFGAYPGATLYEVRRALDVQSRFRDFVMQTQGLEPVELQQQFQQLMKDLEIRKPS